MKMKREEKFILFTGFLLSLSNIMFVIIGENRIDIYVVIYILIYFVSLALFNYDFRQRELFKLNILLISIFITIVIYRIWIVIFTISYMVLYYSAGG